MPSNTYKVGTLEYTKRGLVVLFLWLLWGDFCFTLMEGVEPSVLPFMLKNLGASNLTISMYITTITNIFNLTICPMSSYMSDRYRSKWGRRIPFLVFSTPGVALFLILTGFSKEIGSFLFRHFFHHTVATEAAFTIGLIAVFVIGYQFFNMIVASVYYYLFSDVVPEHYTGRFFAYFRAMGTAAGALFNFFIYPYAQTHGKEIFVGLGILYFVGFLMMCWRVKEGEYPPPPPVEKGKNSALVGIKTFFKESYSHKFYWYFYLSYAFMAVSGAVGVFGAFRNLNVGLSMKDIGLIGGVTGVITTVLLIPAGTYVDRKHPIRVGMTAMIWNLIFVPTNIIFLWNWNHATVLWLTIIITAITLPVGVVYAAAELPLFFRLLPHSRIGQFCSANSVVRSAMMIVAGVAAGYFVDLLRVYCQNIMHIPGDYYYRLTWVWSVAFLALALYYRVKLYKIWASCGGDENYLPPGFEADELELRRVKASMANQDATTPGAVECECKMPSERL